MPHRVICRYFPIFGKSPLEKTLLEKNIEENHAAGKFPVEKTEQP